MTFTEEQIREAIVKTIEGVELLPSEDYAEVVMQELTRPQPEFREGEVFWSPAIFKYHQSVGKEPLPGDRKLRLSEMPEAVERIYKALKDWDNNYKTSSFADYEEMHEALADFDQEIEP